jgi:hypothetical protein
MLPVGRRRVAAPPPDARNLNQNERIFGAPARALAGPIVKN